MDILKFFNRNKNSERKINQVYPLFKRSEKLFLNKTIDNAWVTEGPYTKKFLDQLKSLTNAKYVLPVNNGTLGLFLSLLALDLPKGSEIIIPSFTFFGSVSAAHYAGLKPVFADVSLTDYMLTLENIKSLITEKTKAIMPVHVYGQSVDMDPIIKFANDNNLLVIEDAAQSIGVRYKGRHCGTMGDIGVISFFADKTLTTGEGGVVMTNNEEIFKKAQLIRNQGRPNSGTFIHSAFGMNFRITDMQAALGVAQLERLDEIIYSKLSKYQIYNEKLSGLKNIDLIELKSYSNFVPFRFFIRTKNSIELENTLNLKGVQTRRFFYPMHLQPSIIAEYGDQPRCLNSEELNKTGLCLPIHAGISKKDIVYITDIIKSVIQ